MPSDSRGGNIMSSQELASPLSRPQTRRTVMKTGAKIAYATPVVAASFHLAAKGAGAVSATPCSLVDPNCVQEIDECVDSPGCFCRPTTEGDTFCSPGISCGECGYCATSDDCQPGHRCTLRTCCGRAPGSECCP